MPNVTLFSRALFALHSAGCLANDACKPAVGTFIRKATEIPCFHLTTDYRSASAEELLAQQQFNSAAQYHRWCKQHLRHEHMVPTSVVRQMLLDELSLSEELIAQILRRYGQRATITVEEDGVLNASGFAQSMPNSFWDPKSPLYNNPTARYVEANLFDGLSARVGASWFCPVVNDCREAIASDR